LDEILKDPAIYVQNSHLSNCFQVLNQLNQLRTIKRFDEANEFRLWPTSQTLEMANAKLGSLLSMEELAFPPKLVKPPDPASTAESEESAEEELLPVFKYVPINQELLDSPPHDLRYFVSQNDAYIQRLSQTRKPAPRGCVASDGETEIWLKSAEIPQEPGWVVEPVQPYMPIAEAVGTLNYQRMFRVENGTEIRNGQKFYSFRTPKTVLPPVEALKSDINKESWQDGDLALANCDQRWMSNARGPIRSTFADKVHPRDTFGEFHPLTVDEEWKPAVGLLGPRAHSTKGVRHSGGFHGNNPPALKFDCFVRTMRDPPPLTVGEEYHDPLLRPREEDLPKEKKGRFTTVFATKVKLGNTDSMTVKNTPPTFPPIKPGF
jgi:hypothetical protein